MENFDLKIIRTPENPLEYKVKKDLQMYLMKKMIGDNATEEAILIWIDKFAKEISRVVDDEKNTDIRELAKNKNFKKASGLILDMIEKTDSKRAA